MELFPLFLKLAGRKVVLVGGGRVAAAKHAALAGTGARLTVVAPEIAASLRAPGTEIVLRRFDPADLDGAWLAIAAATPDVNRQVAAAAAERRIFANVVDDPESASAYAGGVVRRGGVAVAISTAGAAPGLAGLLREALDELLPADTGAWVDTAREAREAMRAAGVPMDERRPALLVALNRIYDAPTGARAAARTDAHLDTPRDAHGARGRAPGGAS